MKRQEARVTDETETEIEALKYKVAGIVEILSARIKRLVIFFDHLRSMLLYFQTRFCWARRWTSCSSKCSRWATKTRTQTRTLTSSQKAAKSWQ